MGYGCLALGCLDFKLLFGITLDFCFWTTNTQSMVLHLETSLISYLYLALIWSGASGKFNWSQSDSKSISCSKRTTHRCSQSLSLDLFLIYCLLFACFLTRPTFARHRRETHHTAKRLTEKQPMGELKNKTQSFSKQWLCSRLYRTFPNLPAPPPHNKQKYKIQNITLGLEYFGIKVTSFWDNIVWFWSVLG